MATVDFTARTIELSLAYFGPSQAGSGTNVRHLHRIQPTREKAELRSTGGKDGRERVWWFAYSLPDAPKVPGFEVRLRVASVPGGPDVVAHREDVLAGLDGAVFVADARASRTEDNLAALLDLERSLLRHGIEIASIPVVFQVNQTDAQNARTPERVVEDLNPWGFPVVEAMARQGRGVLETHEVIVAAMVTRLRDNFAQHLATLSLTELSRGEREDDESAVLRHAANLPGRAGEASGAALGLPASAELVLRPAEMRGSVPVQHIRTEIRGERLRVDTVVRRNDGSFRKVALLIEAGGDDAPTTRATRPETAAPAVAAPSRRTLLAEEMPGEMARMTYGISGVTAGIVAGLLLYYILFA